MATIKKPSAKQIAARKRFAEMARKGLFKRKTNPAAKKRAAPKRKTNPSGASAGRHIAKLVEEGHSFKQAEAIAIHEYGIHSKPSAVKAAQKVARKLLNYPDPLRITKRGVVRRNPIAKKRAVPKRNPAAKRATIRPENFYQVFKNGRGKHAGAWTIVGYFVTLEEAKGFAQRYVDANPIWQAKIIFPKAAA